MLTNKSLLYYPQLSFSGAFNTFATSFSYRIVSGYSPDTIQIYDYCENFKNDIIYEMTNLKELDQITIDNKKIYVLSGTYITS